MHSPRRLVPVLFLVSSFAVALAACGGAATPTPAPATPAATSIPSPTVSATADPTPTPPVTTTPAPSPTPTTFVSKAYGYRAVYPGAWLAAQAKQPWDGTSRIDSNGPYTDQVVIPGSILFFVYGAPTDLSTKEYAALGQAQVAEWHGCPAAADAIGEVPVGGTPGELHEFTCLGLLVQKLMVVRDGQGLNLNMLAPPDGEVDPRALFREIVAGITWPG